MRKIFILIAFLALSFNAQANEFTAKDLVHNFLAEAIGSQPSSYQDTKKFLKYFTSDTANLLHKNIKQEYATCTNTDIIFFSPHKATEKYRIVDETTNNGITTIKVKLASLSSGKKGFVVQQRAAKFIVKNENGKWLIDDYYDSAWPNSESFKDTLEESLEQNRNGCYDNPNL